MNFIMAYQTTRMIYHSEVLDWVPASQIPGITDQAFDPNQYYVEKT